MKESRQAKTVFCFREIHPLSEKDHVKQMVTLIHLYDSLIKTQLAASCNIYLRFYYRNEPKNSLR